MEAEVERAKVKAIMKTAKAHADGFSTPFCALLAQ